MRASGTAGQPVTVWIADVIPTSARRLAVTSCPSSTSSATRRDSGSRRTVLDEDKLHIQAIFSGWYPDFPAPAGMIEQTLTCASYTPMSPENLNSAEFCDRSIDREIARAQRSSRATPLRRSCGSRSTVT